MIVIKKSIIPHNTRREEVVDVPLRLKYSAEYLPDKATAGGI